MKILVGSKNPVKLKAVEETFTMYYNSIEVIGLNVNSEVPDQPIGDDTFRGAENRTRSLASINEEQQLNADFFVGIEGGISKIYNNWFAFGAMCVMSKNREKTFGTSAHFELPEIVTKELLKGRELGDVMDEIMREDNTKQKGGAIAFFTLGKMDRKELYIPGLISALVPFNHQSMYFSKK